MTQLATHRAIEAVWRIESARIIGALTRMLRDVGLAQELAQDALVIALENWPLTGVPDNPAAWLMTAAKHRALDRLRHHKLQQLKHAELGRDLSIERELAATDPIDALDNPVDDDVLQLLFIACHPVLPPEGRVALTLRLLGGLSTDEIARAFLVPEPTIAQRIVRAKRTLSAAQVPFEMPQKDALPERLGSVLAVIYLIFNEGYAATAGDDWMRPALCDEALRLGRILAGLAADHSEVHGLVALMEIQASRARARIDAHGQPILLLEQNRARWDHLLIQRGLTALDRARALGGLLGPYALQAGIAACHARARTPAETDWQEICALYDALAQVSPSPVVELNRAVAVCMAFGPEAGLAAVEALQDEPALQRYHLLPAVRADFLFRLGRFAEAAVAFERAASLTRNIPERTLLLARAQTCQHKLLPKPDTIG
ncbi:RNA polymerase sigma factor (sigma-70 family) [Silvimonas terrae]|uniref:RNA polymerase sigma factor (Sigma-70 family) n=1 Tax=Silvimonas terrae TaxID=300266 RepID=A0A840RAD7_9NEIS|nr:RNA polymerase sigma factor [Silvimonas terrae]MBB5189383.1 RNA polymerase sigma factor (sigma-70 family) [Silvimonas terrae]